MFELDVQTPIKIKAYQARVRLILKFCTCVWDPYMVTQGTAHKLESVQRRAARYCLNRYHNTSSVTSMLNLLERRKISRLIMLYKIVNGVVAIPSHPYFQQKLRSFRTHPLGLQPYLQPYQTNIYIQLFPKNNTNMEQLATSNPTGQLMLSKPASIALYSPQVK